MSTQTQQEIDTTTRTELSKIEFDVVTGVTIADLIRKGSENTTQSHGWGQGGAACALSAAGLAAADLGLID